MPREANSDIEAQVSNPQMSNSTQQRSHKVSNDASKSNAASVTLPMISGKARWNTPEFWFYYVVIFIALAYPNTWIMDRSDHMPSKRGLKPGWIAGRSVDLSDHQYRFFRENLILLVTIALIHVGLRRLTGLLCKRRESHYTARLVYCVIFSVGLVLYTTGTCSAFIAVIVLINYLIGKYTTRLGILSVLLTWIFNIFILLANEYYSGYHWAEIAGPSFAYLDRYRGMVPWHVLFNLTVLRMISFNLDYYWAVHKRPVADRTSANITHAYHLKTCLECTRYKQEHGTHAGIAPACYWWREKAHHPLKEYSFFVYIAYLFYPALHFAGPITSFNAFNSHLHAEQQSLPYMKLLKYGLKWLAEFLLMEVALHYIYLFAINSNGYFASLSPAEMAIAVMETLILMWLKFLLIWRFFRLWALCDGVEVPENMNRCVCNNYTVQGFWRSWHRSFNRWLVRYIYIPMGGGGKAASSSSSSSSSSSTDKKDLKKSGLSGSLRKVLTRIGNTFIVFTFVAFWHDRTMQLLAWGWFTVLTFTPELIVSAVLSQPKYAKWQKKSWYRHVKALGGVVNIIFLMAANMIGYSVGVGGTLTLTDGIFNSNETLYVLFGVFWYLYSSCHVMFEYREMEVRNTYLADQAQYDALSKDADHDTNQILQRELKKKLEKARAYF